MVRKSGYRMPGAYGGWNCCGSRRIGVGLSTSLEQLSEMATVLLHMKGPGVIDQVIRTNTFSASHLLLDPGGLVWGIGANPLLNGKSGIIRWSSSSTPPCGLRSGAPEIRCPTCFRR